MRNALLAAAAGLSLSVGAIGAAGAANPNVPSWSPYAVMGYAAAPANPRAMTERRAAQTGAGFRADAPVDYKSVGLSSHREDCNSGCSLGATTD